MKSKLVAMLLAGVTAASLLGGCSAPAAVQQPAQEETKTEEAGAAEETEEAAETEDAVPESAAAQEAGAASDAADSEAEVVNLKILMVSMGWGEHADHMIEKLNELTAEKIGVTADIEWMEYGEMATRVSLAMTAREHFDLINVQRAPVTFGYMYSQNQLMDPTDYLQEYASDVFDVLGDYAQTMVYDGRCYGFPALYNYASHGYLLMREDVLEDLGMMERFDETDSWEEMTELFAEINEKTGLVLGDTESFNTIYGSDTISEAEGYDPLKDSFNLIYTDKEGNVSCKLDNPDYRKQQERIRDWYNDGLVFQDLILDTATHPDETMKNGISFGYLHHSEIGVEAAKEQSTGYKIHAKQTSDIPVYARDGGFVFPNTCEEPEAAAKWLNMLYTDPDMQNLFCWGVEGVDYEVTDEGICKYPEGKGVSDVYHARDFMWGNNFNAMPWEGTSADYRDICREEMEKHPISPYFGFNMNTSDYDNILTGITAAWNQYYSMIHCGAFTDEDWDAYRAKVSAAGIEDLIAGYQEQLDAYMAAKN